MKKSITALVLAFALMGTLAACGTDRNPNANNGTNNGGNNSGTTSGNNSGTSAGNGSGTSAGSGSGTSAGQVSQRYNTNTAMNQGRDYLDDGRYAADANGRVYGGDGNAMSRDLTRGAQDIVRGTEDVMDDIGRGVGNAARDITGMNNGNYSGTPSWEPDSSAVRY